ACIAYMFTVSLAFINLVMYSIRKNEIALKQTHDKLREQCERYESLIDSISEVVVRVDTKFIIEFMKNDYIDKPADQYIGKNVLDIFIDEKARNDCKKNLEYVFCIGNPIGWKWKCTNVNKYFCARATAVKKKQKVVAATILIADITDREISRIKHREAERAELKLKAKTEFISSVSHELRNPLQAISYAVDLLSETKLQEFQKEMVDNILVSVRLLSSIIGKVLDM